MLSRSEIRKQLVGSTIIPDKILQHIHEQKWLQIWVPKQYGGLGYGFAEGLKSLYTWAETDGSLGWLLTLCAGANYFSRNLQPHIAKDFFSEANTCFGGSGMVAGTAEKVNGGYFISGTWRFATGAPYLSHFTLNAKILDQGKVVTDADGIEKILSFVVPRNSVQIIPDWKSMGMRATGTYSFKVTGVIIPEAHSFKYNTFFTEDILDRIDFRIFADLTLLINYLGIASHFAEEAQNLRPLLELRFFQDFIKEQYREIIDYAHKIEIYLEENRTVNEAIKTEIHHYGTALVKNLSEKLLEIYFQLGIRATHMDEPIHQIFCDYFTATQHANFRTSTSCI